MREEESMKKELNEKINKESGIIDMIMHCIVYYIMQSIICYTMH